MGLLESVRYERQKIKTEKLLLRKENIMNKKILSLLLTGALLLTAAGCSAASDGRATGEADIFEPAVNHDDIAGFGGDYEVGDAAGGYDMAIDGVEGDVMEEAVAGDYGEIGGSGDYANGSDVQIQAGTLTAGEWNDNDHWSFWQDLFQLKEEWEDYRTAWNQQYMSRLRVTVSSKGTPCFNAEVILFDENGKELWTGKTDNTGVCWLFYPASAKAATIRATSGYNGATVEVTDSTDYNVDFAEYVSVSSLDLMFVCDTTGSMGDELAYLQKELDSVIGALPDTSLRLSMNFYRDDGDEYVVRSFDFTDDVQQAEEQLKAQDYDGGGDYPEKVNAALDNAINEHQWREDAVKLMFIILDAPPHRNADVAEEMASLVKQAASKGIRVIPVLSSGGDKETEYLMRDFAMKTGGTYLFLTDDSGVSVGGHIQPTVGDYTVEKLNDLMVKVIARYLENPEAVPQYEDIEVEITTQQTTDPQQTLPQDEPSVEIPDDYFTFYNDGGDYGVDGNILFSGCYEDGKFVGELYNASATDVAFTRWVKLYKVVEGRYEYVDYNPDAAMEEDMIIVPAGSSVAIERDLTYMFGELEEGQYELRLDLHDHVNGGYANVSAALTVGEWSESMTAIVFA